MSQQIKTSFERDGYVVLENLFSLDEVASFKAEVKKVLKKVAEANPGAVNRDGVFVGLSANSDVFRQAAADPRVVNILREIIGEHVVFLSDKIVYKNEDTHYGSPWHQDWPYWEGSHKFSVWIALDDAEPDNGCLKVIPGSHRNPLRHGGDASDGHGFVNRMRPEDIDENQAIILSVNAGTAVFFHDLLLHSSYPNLSGKDRWAIITTYKDGGAEDPHYEWAVAAFTVTE